MAADLQRLLMYIVENRVVQNESREAQLDATAVQDVSREIEVISESGREDAQRFAAHFADGLRSAASAQGPLVVEDIDPEGNLIAEAFARFLVAPNLATSHSTPISDGHYRYTFEIDWPRLRELARGAGIDLDAALAAEP